MNSSEDLNESIQHYTAQLKQIEQALLLATEDDVRTNLEKLKQDLTELLNLTQETIDHTVEDEDEPDTPEDAPSERDRATVYIDDEFELFMQEIEQLEGEKQGSTKVASKAPAPTQDEPELDLSGLLGSKCSAPHVHSWGAKVYHNAMVCSLDTVELAHATATVLFTNPTHQEMIPCNYFLEGSCRFPDDRCRYSHGEVVRLDELRDYREPRFEVLRRKGSRALVKQATRLWCKGSVQDADFEAKTCTILLEEGKREQQAIPFEDLFPLDDDADGLARDEPTDGDSSAEEPDDAAVRRAQMVEKSLFQPAPDRRLGEWEEYTRGIGSKIMQKMGYVVGTGLGKEGEGRVIPVSAQVLPQGRSLDYCMELREQSFGDKDLFSVEKRLIQLKKQQERKDARDYARRSKAGGKQDVFSFMNEKVLSGGGEHSKAKHSQPPGGQPSAGRDLKQHSSKNLNIASLKLSEEIRRTEADVERLKVALTRHKTGTPASDNLRRQIEAKRADISRLQATEHNISREQRLRSDKQKLTVF